MASCSARGDPHPSRVVQVSVVGCTVRTLHKSNCCSDGSAQPTSVNSVFAQVPVWHRRCQTCHMPSWPLTDVLYSNNAAQAFGGP